MFLMVWIIMTVLTDAKPPEKRTWLLVAGKLLQALPHSESTVLLSFHLVAFPQFGLDWHVQLLLR